MTYVYILYIITSHGNLIAGGFDTQLECKIERANLIEARHYIPKYVVCRKEPIIETRIEK